MSDEPRKELEQLEMLLLLDEEWFQRELDSAKRMIGQNPGQSAPAPRTNASGKAAPARNYEVSYSQSASRQRSPKEDPAPRHKSIKGLLILAVLESLGILGLAVYWALVLLR